MLHSADTCIGCQYCTWNCSYGVPQYNPERGVVGKCDLCHSRSRHGQSPACVSACPTGAIQVEIVNDRRVARPRPLPAAGARRARRRIRASRRRGSRCPTNLPPNARPVDLVRLALAEPHWPLVIMTVLTQLSVGAFATVWLLQLLGASTRLGVAALTSLLVGGLALAASTLHLGRPVYAYRALKMWRRSWLSREVLLFTAFSVVACLYAGGALDGAARRSRHRRADGGARPRRRHRERLHLSRALAARVEHAVHARAVHADGRDARAAVRGSRRRRRSALAGVAAATMAGAQLVVLALRFFRLSASDGVELQRDGTTARHDAGVAPSAPGRAARAGRHRAAALHDPSGRAVGGVPLALAGEMLGRYLFFVSAVPKHMAAPYLGKRGGAER